MRKTYKIIDAVNLLGVSRDRLFYWIKFQRLTTPEVRGEGRGTRSRLSILNIVELSIAKELASLGIELTLVRRILETTVTSHEIESTTGKRKTKSPKKTLKLSEFVCEEYRKKERDYPSFYLIIFKNEKNEYEFYPLWYVRRPDLGSIMKMRNATVKAMVIVNIFEILQGIEKKLGEKV